MPLSEIPPRHRHPEHSGRLEKKLERERSRLHDSEEGNRVACAQVPVALNDFTGGHTRNEKEEIEKEEIEMKTRRILTIAALVLLASMAAANSAKAQEHPCGDDINTLRVPYAAAFTNQLDSRTDPTDPEHKVLLMGSLHYKTPASGAILKNRPVLIFNHGHEQNRGEACEIVKFFTSKDWVVFTPLRRGHYLDNNPKNGVYDSGELRSTGIYIDKFVDACSRHQTEAESSGELAQLYCGSGFCRAGLSCFADNFRSAIELDYLRQQRIDVRDQIAYIKSLPAIATELVKHTWKLADPGRIVILGHSYGGGLMVFANTEDYGQSVAIDIQGAELSWGNSDDPYWEWDLRDAAYAQQRPIYFFQPKNGKYLLPTKTLFGITVDRLFRSQAAIFPPSACSKRNDAGEETFPPCDETDDTENKQVHGTFIAHAEQIAKWGPAVIEFANRYQR